ncbi:ABC transporter ATP-binding protein [Ellagibacter isourolithinifaciens]|uniref:ABC transporter ATP-binding protein n=1 Tax=Ellagibacter isourolithinifaciens TaxID=2137581 RepID=A0A6N6NL83_9ACTN|nr:ABC transporter ATP-binding protein [Ellagibacter isourolithinifaciens]KAB1640438.1 ABC transporter ATP-binding protein [Ellagibacter isourolithinifaciens]
MFASFKKKYFLSDKGIAGAKRGIFWTTLTNLVVMAGMGFLFLTMAGFIDRLTTGADLPSVLPIAGGLVVFLVLLFASNWQQYYYCYCIFYEECGNQRIDIAERLRKLPLSFFGRRDLADLTETIMGDVQAMEHAYSHVLSELWGAVIASAVVFVGSLFFCWQLAVAAFWSVPVAFAILYLTRGPMTPVFDRIRAEKVRVTEAIQETLDCVREVRATNQEAHYLAGLNAVIDREEREVTRGELVNGLLVNSAFAILRLGIATTLATGAAMVVSGQVDFMVMFAFLLMVSRIYAPFDQALMLVSELFAAESSAKRMRSIMEEPVAQGSEAFEPVGHDVVFDHVAFSYGAGDDGRAGEKVLTDVSFTAKEGEVTALVGPSGSGKSTVSRLAARFWDTTAGTVSVGGVDVASVDPEVLLRDYAIVFQDVLLFDDTVMGNIRLGRRDATDEEVLAAAHAANCDEFVSRMPQGYDTMIGENGSKLSGGERQRISIARALLKDAPIVLLDEATASLDVENETVVQEALSRLLAGKTVIVIAHRMRTVENADKIVVLRDGVVAEQGTPVELKAAGGEFAHMLSLQKEAAAWRL